MTIGRRLTLGFLAIAAMAAVLTAYNIFLSRQVGQLRWIELPMDHHIGQTEESQWEAIFAASSACTSLDPKRLENFEQKVRDVNQNVSRYLELVDTPSERSLGELYMERWALTVAHAREMLAHAEEKQHHQDTFFELTDRADDIIDAQIQARFSPSDPDLLQKERLVREVEVSIWEAVHAAQQYTSLTSETTRAGRPQSSFAELMERQFQDVYEFWTPYRELAQTPEEQDVITTLDKLFVDTVAEGRRVIALHDQIDRDLAELHDLAESSDEIIDADIFPSIVARVAARDRTARLGQLIAILLGAGAIIGAVVIGWLLTRSVCTPIDRLRHATTEIAGGNLDHRIGSEARDEVGVVARAFDRMTEQLSASTDTLQSEIRERTAAEQTLRATNTQLSETSEQLLRVNANLQDFVYIASHDLREPLRKISSFGELLGESLGGTLSEDDQENLEFMIDGSNRMTQMVEGLLAYSRLNSTDAEPEPIELDDTLRGLKGLELATMLDETGGVIETPDELPVVMGTPSEVRQLLQNLLANAVKYRREGIAPHIKIAVAPDREGMIRLRVSDNGIGIPEEHRDGVFKMFRRLHTRDEFAGAGIGLAVCRKIVEKHGGTIGLEASDDVGTTVWFTLPCASEHEQITAAA